MKKLIVIDMQQDFINENTEKSIEEINSLIESKKFDDIIFTRYIGSSEKLAYKELGDTSGLTPEGMEIVVDYKDYKILDKKSYSIYETLKEFISLDDEIYLCGVDVDCCILLSAINLYENNYNVYVLKDYSYCMNGEDTKSQALHVLIRNIGEKRVI